MRLAVILVLSLAAAGGYYYYSTRPGPAEQAGAVLDEAIDKSKRIIEIVTE